MKYIRYWECWICKKAVIIDSVKLTQSCGCIKYIPNERQKKNLKAYMQTKDFRENYAKTLF